MADGQSGPRPRPGGTARAPPKEGNAQAIFTGIVDRGFQFASGQAVGRDENPSCFPAGTLKMQAPLLKARGIDLEALVPELFWGTINVRTGRKLKLASADYEAAGLDWTAGVAGRGRIGPETISFIHCRLVYPSASCGGGHGDYPGLVYYPHPETKPATNAHDHHVLEVLTSKVPDLAYGTLADIVCRADAFEYL